MNLKSNTTIQLLKNDSIFAKIEGMRIVFMGTPDFAVTILKGILATKHEVVGVVTTVDKQAGRGRKIQESAVKKYATEQGLNILQPEKFKTDDFLIPLKALNADLFVVVAFRMFAQGCLGHASERNN